jgi:hypothetical protein
MEQNIISTDIKHTAYTFSGFSGEKTFCKNKLEGLLRPHPQLSLKAVPFPFSMEGAVRGRGKKFIAAMMNLIITLNIKRYAYFL